MTMQFVGTVNSEETMAGKLKDGRMIYVWMLAPYLNAPVDRRDDPEYWLERYMQIDLRDPDNYPLSIYVGGKS